MRLLLLALALVGGLAAGPVPLASAWQDSRSSIEIGQPYPDFVLPRIDNGRPLRLSDYRGQKVVLVHFASW